MATFNKSLVPPSLSPALHSYYLTLSSDERKQFNKVFMLIWNTILPMRCFTGNAGLLYSYFIVDLVRSRFNMTPARLSLLSYLYHITHKGADIVHSKLIYNGLFMADVDERRKYSILSELKKAGLIKRLYSDPSQPYLSRFRSCHPEFIQLTGKGVDIFVRIEKDIQKLLLESSWNDLTGIK